MFARALLALTLLAACSSPTNPTQPGPYAVASTTLLLEDAARALPVEVWYPAVERARAAAEQGEPIAAMIVGATDRARYEALLADAPPGCPTRTVHSARDADPAEGPWPLVVYSHCHACTRSSIASVAERLASHGIAVAAPDHLGNTLFDLLDDDLMGLNEQTLRMRVADVRFVLDALLAGAGVPEKLKGRFDATRLGAMGHSFGSVTTGVFAREEPRIKAVVGLAAPMENPLLPYVKMAEVPQPVLFLLAREDNSITEFGNDFIRDNFDEATGPAWKVEVDDAGHFSFHDLVGLHPSFEQGCGDAKRQTTSDETFTYLAPAQAVAVAQSWVTAFFAARLQDDEAAQTFLTEPPSQAGVGVEAH